MSLCKLDSRERKVMGEWQTTQPEGSGSEIYLNTFFVFKYYRLSLIILNTLNERQKKELRGNL